MTAVSDADVLAFVNATNEITTSLASVRDVIQATLKKAQTSSDFDTKDGISLLSLKNDVMLSYLQSLVLLSSHRILGHSLLERSPPSANFGSAEREARGYEAGDLIDSAVESRAILEKTKALEARMRYQIDKLVRVAEETVPQDDEAITHDPLAFRPNLHNLVTPAETNNADLANDFGRHNDDEGEVDNDGIYHPPKLAPVPYNEPSKKSKRAHVPSALHSLAHLDPSVPHTESTSGLGSMPTMSSARARELERMTRFEEENMTRLLLNKRETNRRKQDEGDIALGGSGASGRRGGGLEDEFGDVLRSIGRAKSTLGGDGYDELRQRSKKSDVLSRSRVRKEPGDDEGEGMGGQSGGGRQKRGRFEKEVKGFARKTKKSSRR